MMVQPNDFAPLLQLALGANAVSVILVELWSRVRMSPNNFEVENRSNLKKLCQFVRRYRPRYDNPSLSIAKLLLVGRAAMERDFFLQRIQRRAKTNLVRFFLIDRAAFHVLAVFSVVVSVNICVDLYMGGLYSGYRIPRGDVNAYLLFSFFVVPGYELIAHRLIYIVAKYRLSQDIALIERYWRN